ncbi:MAG TPA: rhomboid family intramembrane serine protease [Lentimicrobium sp.]|nr:rhomboid family intramembrane serine protease [Lentimicrobium sp.]
MALTDDNEEKRKLLSSALIGAALVSALWIVKAAESLFNTSFVTFGILPLKAEGLIGIVTAPLVHGSIEHLISNSIPFFLLTAALFYYYRPKARQILIILWLVTGFWLWLFARGRAYHIGASGVVYALASFHFISGVIRREPRLAAFSLLVTFLYGSFVWGIFPGFALKERISWEGHLMGGIAGFVLAFFYKDVGPQKHRYWEEEDDDDDDENEDSQPPFTYFYKEENNLE